MSSMTRMMTSVLDEDHLCVACFSAREKPAGFLYADET